MLISWIIPVYIAWGIAAASLSLSTTMTLLIVFADLFVSIAMTWLIAVAGLFRAIALVIAVLIRAVIGMMVIGIIGGFIGGYIGLVIGAVIGGLWSGGYSVLYDVYDNFYQFEKWKRSEFVLYLLTAGLGNSLGILYIAGLTNPYILFALTGTSLPALSMLLYPPLKRRKLIAKYRQSEESLIKP